MKLVIPAAGHGRRFAEAGYKESKPFIPVNGKPLLGHVLDNLHEHFAPSGTIVVLRKDQKKEFNKSGLGDRCTPFYINGPTEGAACTVLAAKELVELDEPLLIANSDQLIYFEAKNLPNLLPSAVDGTAVFCFDAPGRSTKWSYAAVLDGRIKYIAEKIPISDTATCGVYYFSRAGLFEAAADRMIKANYRHNGEFYVAPAFNFFTKPPVPIYVNAMVGLGTPEDLQASIDVGYL